MHDDQWSRPSSKLPCWHLNFKAIMSWTRALRNAWCFQLLLAKNVDSDNCLSERLTRPSSICSGRHPSCSASEAVTAAGMAWGRAVGQDRNASVDGSACRGTWMRCPRSTYPPWSRWICMRLPGSTRAKCSRNILPMSLLPSTCAVNFEDSVTVSISKLRCMTWLALCTASCY